LFLCVAGMVCEGLDLQSAGVAAAGIVKGASTGSPRPPPGGS
jgi:hypothetical protein